jgi:hypothetical protein
MIIGMMSMRHVSFVRAVFTDDEFKQMTTPILLMLGDHEIMYDPRKAMDCATRLIPKFASKTHCEYQAHVEQ